MMTIDAKNVLNAFNKDGAKMEFSNDGKAWVTRTLIGVNVSEKRPFMTAPIEGSKHRGSWELMREKAPVPEMTIEEVEAKFGIKVAVSN